jgi:glycine cleavage system H protein
LETPDDLRYARTHEWARRDGELVRVGVTDYAQEQLGDIVFLELPEAGQAVTAGEPFGVVESVKAVDDLHAPVAGEVAEVNGEVLDQPEIVNEDPYGRGWVVAIRPSDAAELNTLMDGAAYRKHCEEEGAR